MYIKARSKKDFVYSLIKKVNSIKGEKGFVKKLKNIKDLAAIDPRYFLAPNNELKTTFNGRRFSINETNLLSCHDIELITSEKDYETIICHGIEKIVKSFFIDGQIRKVIQSIAVGDEVLCSAIQHILHQRTKWEHNTDDKKNKSVDMFPLEMDKNGNIRCYSFLSNSYTKDLNLLVNFCNIIWADSELCIGNYNISTTETSNNELPDDVLVEYFDDFIPYDINIKLDSFKPFEDQQFSELIYNASKGHIFDLNHEDLEKIEEEISSRSDRRSLLWSILFLLCSARFPDAISTYVFNLIEQIFGYLDFSLEGAVLNRKFTGKKKLSSKVFYYFLRTSSNATFFKLLESEEDLITIVDGFGIKKENIKNYILIALVRRFKDSSKLDMTIKDLFNSLTESSDKEFLLSIVFNRN